jgi:hypothetical protein
LSTDGGVTFGSIVNRDNSAEDSFDPPIAAAGNNVYVAWHDNSIGDTEILHRRSTDGGGTFGSAVNLSSNEGSSQNPNVAAIGNNVYVGWEATTFGNREILQRRSTSTGTSFGTTVNLSNNPGISNHPSIAAVNNLPIASE